MDHDDDSAFERYVDALLEGDVRVGRKLFDDLRMRGVSLPAILSEFVQRGMYEIGRRWEREQLPVAYEHLAASTTQLLLSELLIGLERPPVSAKRVVIACAPDELHDLGAMVVAVVFQNAGWETVLLGANVPAPDLVEMLSRRQPDLLALSLTIPENREGLEEVLALSATAYPELAVLVGGQALAGDPFVEQYRESLLAQYPAVRYLASLDELLAYLACDP